MNKFALVDVLIVDVIKDNVFAHQSILINDGIIHMIKDAKTFSVPNDYKVIECRGCTVIPGLIDAHVHLLQSGVDDFLKPYKESFNKKLNRHLMQNLKAGITTVRNMPGGQGDKVYAIRDDINLNNRIAPRIITSGPALSAPHGYFSTKMFFPFLKPVHDVLKRVYKVTSLSVDVDTPKEAINAVDDLKSRGVDFIKTTTTGAFMPYADDQKMFDYLTKKGMKPAVMHAHMKDDVLKAIVKRAHEQGLKVAAHSIYHVSDFKRGVEIGIDSLEHTPFGIIDDATFDLMKAQKIYWVPTAYAPVNYLQMLDDENHYDHMMKALPKAFFKLGKQSIERIKKQLNAGDELQNKMIEDIRTLVKTYIPTNIKRAMEKGVTMVAAVDAGASGAGYVPHGMLHRELSLYQSYGMSALDALKTATINAAHLLGLQNDIGSIEVGKKADLVICRENPTEDIDHLNTIQYVMKGGALV